MKLGERWDSGVEWFMDEFAFRFILPIICGIFVLILLGIAVMFLALVGFFLYGEIFG